MAAAMVVEALLSASVETLRDRITSSEFQDFLKNRKLNVSLLDEMKTTLLMLNAVLNDAEEKQITDPAVKQWLDELKDAVLDAEDLLDKINTDSLRCKIEQDSADQNVIANKVMTFLPSSFSQLSWGMNSKLEAVTQRLNNFAKQTDILGLKSVSLRAHKTSTTSFVNESVVVTHDLLPKLECLRVLSLAGYGNITELPNSIGNLEHLRYLNLESTSIQRLPDAICTLYNMKTLILSYCRELIELPKKIGNLTHLRYLDISETGLKEMPTQISKLHNLRSLSTFFVGRHQDGLRVSELKKFPHLQGKLCILNLQNVVDSMDAVKADLKSKQQIEELVLEWGSDTQDSQLTRDVLDKLQSSTNLRRLAINYYGGTSFPNWVGDSSFSNITYLSIRDCKYCFSLPPFGQLLLLKRLSIRGMKSMQTIGHEFYFSNIGSSSFHPFPSLEYLKFVDMPNWEEWLPIEAEGKILPFPRLQTLILYMCPNLRGDLPNHLPSLKECSISGCNQLEAKSSLLHWITSIDKLSIEECGQGFLGVFDSDSQSSLSELRIEKCDSLQCLPRMILRGDFLTGLDIRDIPSLMCFPNNSLPTSLTILQIENCEKLEFLPQEVWLDYTSLETLFIRHSCHSLTSFPLGCFPQLKSLSIEGCPNLELFTQVEESALTLESFDITECKSLKSMSQVQSNSLLALTFLALRRLPNLESLPQGGFPCNLGSITVLNCEKLSSMAIAEWGFQQLSCLSSFEIGGDDIINKLLNQRLLPTSLEELFVSDLSYLKGLQYLTSLKELHICHCSDLESLPEDELPSSLMFLRIYGCPKLEERYGNQKGKHLSKIARYKFCALCCIVYSIQQQSWGRICGPASFPSPVLLQQLQQLKVIRTGVASVQPVSLVAVTLLVTKEPAVSSATMFPNTTLGVRRFGHQVAETPAKVFRPPPGRNTFAGIDARACLGTGVSARRWPKHPCSPIRVQ
ncbi:putative disease resistance RPP13-like protein 1 [Senna tora]|uniref:Putative disease resistance RPP13-like protein 1 n=1 Tax=Senna tora TaxID=362788 RepID=A0A834TED3_9FABA|nr:putative disease resistance RPP13-like protein 1 [Senna tora]